MKTDRVVIVDATVDRKREQPALIVRDMMAIEEAAQKLTTHVVAKFDAATHTDAHIDQMRALFAKYKGGIEVGMIINTGGGKVAKLTLGREVRVRPAPEFVKEFESTFGRGSVELIGPGSRRKKMLEQQRLFAERQAADVASEAPHTLDAPELEEVEL